MGRPRRKASALLTVAAATISAAEAMNQGKSRLLILAGLVALFVAGAFFLPVAEWTTSLAERVRRTGGLGVALFLVAYVVATVAFLPGSILTLAAGFAYGPLWGVAIVSPASLAGATCAFLLGRTLLRGWA